MSRTWPGTRTWTRKNGFYGFKKNLSHCTWTGKGTEQGQGRMAYVPIFQVLKLFQVMCFNCISMAFRCPVLAPDTASVNAFCILSVPVPVPETVMWIYHVGHRDGDITCNGLLKYIHCRTRTRTSIRVQISISKMGTVTIRDPDLDQNLSQSLCNGNSFCTVQCSHRVWSLNPVSKSVSGNINKS